MVSDIELFVLLIATVLGALTSWFLSWKESGHPFDIDKASSSWIRAAIAALAVFLAEGLGGIEEVSFVIYIGAFFTGMAIDAGGNRLAGNVLKKT